MQSHELSIFLPAIFRMFFPEDQLRQKNNHGKRIGIVDFPTLWLNKKDFHGYY